MHSPAADGIFAIMKASARALLLGVALFSAPARLRAQEPRAEASAEARRDAAARFEEGTRAFDAGDFRRAGELFEIAYKLAPHEDPLWNAARAWQRAGELARAANLYARYLRVAPEGARDRGKATQAMAQLAGKLARIEVQLGRGVDAPRVDGQPIEDTSVYVVPGSHIVRARAPGEAGDIEAEKTVAAGETVSVVLSSSSAPGRAVEARPVDAAPAPEPRADDRHGLPPIVVVLGAVATGALAGVTTWSGLETMNTLHAFEATPTQETLDRGRSEQARTNLFLAGTVGVAAVTALTAVFFTDWRPDPKRRVRVGFGPGGASIGGALP